jgi:hypothetical protein
MKIITFVNCEVKDASLLNVMFLNGRIFYLNIYLTFYFMIFTLYYLDKSLFG